MGSQRQPRGGSGHEARSRADEPDRAVRPRPAEVEAANRARSTRRLALGAAVVGGIALGLAAWSALPRGEADCQPIAWDSSPAAEDLPAGWALTAAQYDINRATFTLLGPAPADETSAQAVVYVTVTCYARDAADAVTRSADAATAAGQLVSERTDLGEQGFVAYDQGGAEFLQFRHGSVVAYLAASGDATPAEVDLVAGAFDLALGGDGVETAVGTTDPTVPGAVETPDPALESEDSLPSETPSAPELVALLPTSVAGSPLTIDSALGSEILADDQISRAISAALREEGRSPDDLHVAQAYDETEAIDLSLLAVRVEGMDPDAVRRLVLDSWLSASGAGVTQSAATLAGREFTAVDYGDDGTVAYLVQDGDAVLVIETADADLAAEAAAALP